MIMSCFDSYDLLQLVARFPHPERYAFDHAQEDHIQDLEYPQEQDIEYHTTLAIGHRH